MLRLATFASVLLLLAAIACGGSDSGGSNAGTPDPDQGKTAEKAIKAADGGTLATPSGNATLTVPAGALPADLTLTVAVAAAENGSKTSVYDFGPTGTTFLKPVSLSIAFDGTVGSNQKAALAWWNGTKWEEVAGSSLAGGKVTGSVTHFSKFTVIFVDGQVVVTSGCASVAKDFKACGGDPAGVWTFEDVCFEAIATGGGDNPFAEFCPTATTDIEVTWDGTITFADGKAKTEFKSQTMTMTMKIPLSCFEKQPGMTCEMVAKSSEKLTCATKGSNCECTQSDVNSEASSEDVGDYKVVGNSIVFTKDGKETSNEFCQTGSTAVVKATSESNGKTQTFYLVLKKK